MSDATPSPDFFEQLIAKADEIGPELLKRLEESASNQGRRTVTLPCSKCGNRTSTVIDVVDQKDVRDTLALITSMKRAYAEIQSKRTGDDTSQRARATLQAVAEMSSEEIAEELARLDEDAGGL